MKRVITSTEFIHLDVDMKLLERFKQYCINANARNISFVTMSDTVYVVGISDARLRELAEQFKKVANCLFEYTIAGDCGTSYITKLMPNTKHRM